ncbi:MAG: DUF5360 family protein [Bacteroidia bacterium]|nr:DUF5360 family protein [Bacteroidia bacterium]
MQTLRYFFLVTDIGFLLYWGITVLHLIPAEYLYNDYTNPILVDWNWSFFPLDMLVSATGLSSLWLYRRQASRWQALALISLVLTSVSGLQAIAFWVLRHDYDLTWWIPNLFLFLYPLFFIPKLIRFDTA